MFYGRDARLRKFYGWTTVFSPAKNNLIGHTGDVISHTGLKAGDDVLRRNIKDKNPGSALSKLDKY